MERLRETDFRALLAFVERIHEPCDAREFALCALDQVARLVPGDYIVFNEFDTVSRATIQAIFQEDAPPFPDVYEAFERHMLEHPIIAETARIGDGPAMKLSDFLSQRQLRDLGLYQEVFAHVDGEHQMTVQIPAPPTIVAGIAINRSVADFTERERTLLNLARPHLAQAHRSGVILTLLRAGIEATGYAALLVASDGRVLWAIGPALAWIATYFDASVGPAEPLPDELRGWLAEQRHAWQPAHALDAVAATLVVERDNRRLVVRVQPGSGAERLALLLLKEQVAISVDALAATGLTRREAEVLFWVVQGKADKQIADLLLVSLSTVHRHMERIREKLGVQSRAEAVVRALALVRS